jgi:hypothetical protein
VQECTRVEVVDVHLRLQNTLNTTKVHSQSKWYNYNQYEREWVHTTYSSSVFARFFGTPQVDEIAEWFMAFKVE